MKNIILATALVITGTSASALTNAEVCGSFGEYAYDVMRLRQYEVPLQMALENINPALAPELYDYYVNVTLVAYEQMMMPTTILKNQMAVEYQNTITLQCYRAAN